MNNYKGELIIGNCYVTIGDCDRIEAIINLIGGKVLSISDNNESIYDELSLEEIKIVHRNLLHKFVFEVNLEETDNDDEDVEIFILEEVSKIYNEYHKECKYCQNPFIKINKLEGGKI